MKDKNFLDRNLQEKREKEIYRYWLENKNSMTMEDIRKIFSLSLSQVYKIIKQYDKNNNKK
jgi:predicted transcriptional regulator